MDVALGTDIEESVDLVAVGQRILLAVEAKAVAAVEFLKTIMAG